jgi:hypothetical protein
MHRSMKVSAVVLAMAAVSFSLGAWAAHAKEIVLTPPAEVKWGPMDAKAGDKGPQIAVVFGDPKKGPFGALLKFPPGTRPGPHIHTSDYYGVIISGAMANFAPGGQDKPVVPGGYYFQPGKVPHDNHCAEGAECVMFMYMPGALDFKPAAQTN